MGLCCAVIYMGDMGGAAPERPWERTPVIPSLPFRHASLRPSCEDDTVIDRYGCNYSTVHVSMTGSPAFWIRVLSSERMQYHRPSAPPALPVLMYTHVH